MKGKIKISFDANGASYRFLRDKKKRNGASYTFTINEALTEKARREKKGRP